MAAGSRRNSRRTGGRVDPAGVLPSGERARREAPHPCLRMTLPAMGARQARSNEMAASAIECPEAAVPELARASQDPTA